MKVRIECKKNRPHSSEEECQQLLSDKNKTKRFIPYYEKIELINPDKKHPNEKQKWTTIFEEIKKSKILDLGIHPTAQEGGFTIYYELPSGEQKAFILGYTELGEWIEYNGQINDKPKEIKVGSKVKIARGAKYILAGSEDIYDRVFIVKKIKINKWAKDGNGNFDESYDEIIIRDAENGSIPLIKGLWESEFMPTRKEVVPV